MMAILSGIETACWDIMGKETNQPVYNLLGGKVRDRVRSYTYIYPAPGADNSVYSNADISCERAATYIKEGFTALKFDPVGPYSAFDPRQLSLEMLDFTEKFVKQLRDAVGNKVDLLFGTHGQMTPAGAIRLAKRLEKFDPLWFEEPTPPDMPEEMARVAAATSIPVATGERLATKYEFARVLRHNAAAILQPAIGRVGGIMETKKIAAIAETHYAQIAPHLYAGPIEAAANLHVDLSTPNFLIQESIGKMENFHSKILKKPLPWENGYFLPTTEPGLGVELNEEVAIANPYTGKRLHLEMHQEPLN
jgi:2-dehydro-3-deoxyphosphogalactonate aldolase